MVNFFRNECRFEFQSVFEPTWFDRLMVGSNNEPTWFDNRTT